MGPASARSIAWTAHPAKRRPQDLALAAMIVLASVWAILVTLESALLAGVAFILLLVAIAPFLLPTHYVVDATGVREHRLFVKRARPWTELQRIEIGKTMAFVSPYKQRRWLDRYRGIVLMLPEDPVAVVATLREHSTVGRASVPAEVA